MRKRNRELSSTVPEPKTRFQGSPVSLIATCVMTSTGLVTSWRCEAFWTGSLRLGFWPLFPHFISVKI